MIKSAYMYWQYGDAKTVPEPFV